jgi:hypothetical protein
VTPGGKGCLGALAAAAAVVGIAGALVGPRLLRTARQVYAPVAEMKRAERAVREMADQHPWNAPAAPAVTEDQLRRFLAVRRKLDALYGEVGPRLRALPRRRGSIRDVPAVLNGVGSVVSRQLQALIDEGMSPEEYRYLERVIYRQWREGLRGAGSGPAVTAAAASAIEEAAAGEKDARTARRLREAAAGLRHRTPSPPPGIPSDVHALLLAHADEIERYSLDAYDELPMPRPR